MDVFRRQKFNEAMFAKNRTLAIRVGQYQSRDINEASFDYGYIKGDAYKPGGTCAGSAKIVFASVITSFRKLDKIYPEIGLLVDGTYEWVKMGEYFINDIEIDRNRKTTKLDLMDGMFKLNREHVTDLTYPAEIRNVIKEICLKTGIELANENMGLASMNYRIEQIPKDKKMTFRDVLSLATQMLGMSCFFNREGKLEIKELTDSGITITADSYFMHGLTKSEIEYQIAGITCKKDKETLTVGLRTGRSLEIDNLFMSQSILDNLYHNIKDIRYYPFSLNYQGHLLLDVGQWVTIKTNTGETFKSPVLSQSFNFKGGLRGRISADSKAGNDAQYSYAGSITKKIEQFSEFEKQLQNQIEEADRGFDAKVDQIKQDFNEQIELAKAKAEENKKKLSEEINRRFQEFNPSGFEEAKAKSEEALKKAGASSDLAEQMKGLVDTTRQNFDTFKSQVYNNFVTDNQLRSDLSTAKTELKKYVKEETDEKTSAIRETIANGFVAKSTYLENVEGINQRFETLKRDNEVKLADYKQGIDGRFANIASQMAGKVNDVDFQRVRETAQLYERIFGGAENDVSRNVSRMVMSNQVFQTEVGKYVTDDNNLIVNSLAMGKNTLIGDNNPKATVSVNDGIFTIKAQGLTGYNWTGFTLPIYVKKIYHGETYTLGFKYRIREYPDSTFAFNVKNHSLNKTLLSSDIGTDRPLLNKWQEFQKTFTVQEDFDFGNDSNYPFYIFLAKNGWIEFKEPILVRGSKTGPYKPSQFDDAYKMTEATRTQMTLLQGSWAVQNLTNAGDIINGINVGANGNNRIIGRATHITGDTLIDNAVIKSAMIDKLKTANFEAGSVTTNILGAEAVTAEKVKFDTAFIQRLVSQQAFINELFAKQATITKIQNIDFTGNHIKGGRITSLNGQTIFDLQSGWVDMNQPGVGIRNKFAGRPLQYLVFGQGTLHGKDGSYTALMSNSNNKVAMDDGAAGIQIWNTNDNTSAVNLYGDMIDFMYNASDPQSIHFDTIKNEISNLETIWIKGKSLEIILNDIFWNFRVISDGGANLPYNYFKYWNGNK